jgi:hypothetical protein
MATSTIQTNDNNDIYLPDGRNIFIMSGEAACEQNIRQATLMRLKEDIYNQNNGVDYFGTIFTPQQNYDAARKSLSTVILACPDVLSIESLTITITANTFNYVANVVTIYGPLKVSNQL